MLTLKELGNDVAVPLYQNEYGSYKLELVEAYNEGSVGRCVILRITQYDKVILYKEYYVTTTNSRIESYREIQSSLEELYSESIGNQSNDLLTSLHFGSIAAETLAMTAKYEVAIA